MELLFGILQSSPEGGSPDFENSGYEEEFCHPEYNAV
jgi:hypothetical protein